MPTGTASWTLRWPKTTSRSKALVHSAAAGFSSVGLGLPSCPYSPTCVEGEFLELRIDGVLRSWSMSSPVGATMLGQGFRVRARGQVRSWCSLLVLGADLLGASLCLGLFGGALRNPHERYPKRRPQRRQHERKSPDRHGQQRYLHHDEGRDHPTFLDNGGGGDLQHVEQDCRCYGGEAPTGGKANQGDEVRSLHPPLDPLAESDGRQKERQDPGRSLDQGHRKPTARIVERLQVLEGPEVPAQDAEGEHDHERSQPHHGPEPRAQSVGGMDILHDRLIWQVRSRGHAFLPDRT